MFQIAECNCILYLRAPWPKRRTAFIYRDMLLQIGMEYQKYLPFEMWHILFR